MHSLLLALYWNGSLLVTRVSAQIFDGPGLQAGVDTAAQINGPLKTPIRDIVLSFLYKALWFLGLIGVVTVIIAGFFLILSGGEDTGKDRAKKMILYLVIGLLVIFVAQAIVGFFLNGLE